MNITLSPALKDAIRKALEQTERDNGILDAYGAAARIQSELPNENVALEDIISALLLGRGAIRAIEFTPPVTEVLEVVMPASGSERAAVEGQDVIVAG